MSEVTHFRAYTNEIPTTCDVCKEAEWKIFPTEEYQERVTAPPFHPNCRCMAEFLDNFGNVVYAVDRTSGWIWRPHKGRDAKIFANKHAYIFKRSL